MKILAILLFLFWVIVCFLAPKELFNLLCAIIASWSIGTYCAELWLK